MRAQRGNILFLILLAVILFAALSYAVTSSMRGGGTSAGPEKARAIAAEIVNYTTLMEQAVTRLRLSGGCDIGQITFDNPVVSGYTNSSAPSDKHCNVFDPAGGGMSWKTPDTGWLIPQSEALTYPAYSGAGWGFIVIPFGQVCVQQMGTGTCVGPDTEKEVVVGLGYLKKDICDAINAQLGLTTAASAEMCSPMGDPASKWNGLFYNGGQFSCGGTVGKAAYCQNSQRTGYTFYHVLMAR